MTPVTVVGAGPVGMVTALELAHHGVPSVLVEQSLTTTSQPKLDVINTRSMELFDRLGLASDVRAAGVAPEHAFDVIWSTGLDGEVITTWDLPSVNDVWDRIRDRNDGTQPAQPWQRMSQTVLEPILRTHCEESELIDLRCGKRIVGLEQDDDGVTTYVADVASGDLAAVRSGFVVGCDGPASTIRDMLGIAVRPVTDVPDLPGLYQVHLRSHDLATLHRHGRFWHYFAFRYVILAQDEVETWTVHAHAEHPDDFTVPPEDPAGLVRSLLGLDLDIDEVLVTSRWRPRFVIADSYRKDRVFLAGDAAHQMFPTGGYGMNTGVADAVDIGWKLSAVIRSWGGPKLLDSYETERRPVALNNIHMSRRHIGVHVTAGRMLKRGRPLAEIAEYLQAERGENEYSGVELGDRYNGSPVVCDEPLPSPAWDPWQYIPTTTPGSRPPSVLTAEGHSLFEQLGSGFTLVDFAGDGRAEPLLAAAQLHEVTIRHVVIHDDHARRLWERDLVLIRPDQRVAWRSNTEFNAWNVMRVVTGNQS
ncbi:FAD-dependent monooxygenase [Phytoactinopolyspora limicola]|uniref:FAD-dependent monooxygenase n=1 Tax=Phytoactinopolyspora limicola TaxID=2715536 RepID=UPI001407E29E|nr:FAD-dependent monooxygenase [Phytoactinopolyspora limicola]